MGWLSGLDTGVQRGSVDGHAAPAADEMAQCDRLFAAAAERITDGTDGA